jgi:carboxyl-terminal processing protease
MSDRQLVSLLADARVALGKRPDLAGGKDLTRAVRHVLRRHDPAATYIPPEEVADWGCVLLADMVGIGARLATDARTDQLLIVTPLKGGPAHRAGLYAGDVITAITREVDENGDLLPGPEKTLTKWLSLGKSKVLLLGQRETKVVLTVQREGRARPFDVTVVRGKCAVESVLGFRRKKNDNQDFLLDRKDRIGYVRLDLQARDCCRDLEKTMKELTRQGIKGLVLDLRFTPSGLLDNAIRVSDLFIDDGVILRIQGRDPERAAEFTGEHAGSLLGFPMVCLINGDSFGSAEVVAAALQDHKRVFLIGERSKGRASVQNIRDFDVIDPKTGKSRKAEIKMTTAEFIRPNGQRLHRRWPEVGEQAQWGVVPDKVVKLTARERKELREHLERLEWIARPQWRDRAPVKDRQLDTAVEYLRGRIKGG